MSSITPSSSANSSPDRGQISPISRNSQSAVEHFYFLLRSAVQSGNVDDMIHTCEAWVQLEERTSDVDETIRSLFTNLVFDRENYMKLSSKCQLNAPEIFAICNQHLNKAFGSMPARRKLEYPDQ